LYAQNEAAELAKKLADPIASLISVPPSNNTNIGIGSLEGTRNTLKPLTSSSYFNHSQIAFDRTGGYSGDHAIQ
jgi:hypothetical protein